ncbi:MAG TPA: hypothetical protein VF281_03725 [Candidatus Saccharimonadales bacterium]
MTIGPEQSIPQQSGEEPRSEADNTEITRIPHTGSPDSPFYDPPAHPNQPELTNKIVNDTKAPDTVYDALGGDQVQLGPQTKAEFDQSRAAVRDRHTQPTSTQDVDNKKTKEWHKRTPVIGGAIAAIAAVALSAGIGIGVKAGIEATTPTTTPTPDKTSAAPFSPGGVPLPAEPTPRTSETISYKKATVEDVQNYDALLADAVITAAEGKNAPDIQDLFVEKINDYMNITLTEEEITASQNMISPTGIVGPQALHEIKRSAYNTLFGYKEGGAKPPLMKTLEEQSIINFTNWLQTRNDPDPFQGKLVPSQDGKPSAREYAYVDNSKLNSIKDKEDAKIFVLGVYPTLSATPRGGTADQSTWSLDPKAALTPTEYTEPNILR